MSLWWRDQVRILLSPRQVALLRLSRGRSTHITDKRIIHNNASKSGEPLWLNAVNALETALHDFGTRKADAVVLLSNHFVRYTLVMHSDEINGVGEEEALTRHHFTRIYGATADQWALRLSESGKDQELRVACAVDRSLQETLLAQFKPTHLTLSSIQPYLMTAYNRWRHRIDESAWFALVEQGSLCLARFQDRRWHSIKAIKIGDDWFGDLTVQLEREKFFSASETVDSAKIPVFVYAPGYEDPLPLQAQRHSFQMLRSSHSDNGETIEAPYEMVLMI